MKIFDVIKLQNEEKAIIKVINGTNLVVELLSDDKTEGKCVEIKKEEITGFLYKH